MENIWNKLPAFIKAILIGALLFYPAITIIQFLLFANLRNTSSLPWSLLLILPMLWLYWSFCSGAEKPFGYSQTRKDLSMSSLQARGNAGWILLSILGIIVFTYASISVGYAFVDEDTDQLEMLEFFFTAPIQTAIPLLFALSLTAGIIEETVFRGYVQTILERNYGVVLSFGVTAIIFALMHFLPPILILPYTLVSLAFSYVAYKTRSIVPGVIAHFCFDFIAITLVYFNPYMAKKAFFEEGLIVNVVLIFLSMVMIGYSQYKVMPTELISESSIKT